MEIKFLGTLGEIEEKSESHKEHSSLLLDDDETRILFDWGESHKDEDLPDADALFLTHSHKDHTGGLEEGVKYGTEVYCPEETLDNIEDYLIEEIVSFRRKSQEEFEVGDFTIIPFAVEHSIKEPTVGYKVLYPEGNIFYAPDCLWIIDREEALEDVDLYVGDGSSPFKSLVRSKDSKKYGHSSISAQLVWIRKAGVPQAIFTHFGRQIVTAGDIKDIKSKVVGKSEYEGILDFAEDGEEYTLVDKKLNLSLEQLIKDISEYDPSEKDNEVLMDDWRILIAWTADKIERGEW